MAIMMKDPETGFSYPIHKPFRAWNIIQIIWYARFWFAALIATKPYRLYGVVGVVLLVATIALLSLSDDKTVAAVPALVYVALGLYFGPRIPKIYAQHYLAKGWVFAEPDADETKAARAQWHL